jgi:putative SbcD/Mre11-related phosphoesterase
LSSVIPLTGDFAVHCSGALWIPASSTLVIADIHLGYGWAQRRRGDLGPLADVRTKEKLLAVCGELHPAELVFLGDLVHAPKPCAAEREWIEEILTDLATRIRITAVRGNHDRAFAREFGHLPLATVAAWQTSQVTALHGDRFDVEIPERHTTLVGHLHPSLTLTDPAGAPRKLPVFLYSPRCILLPAFSPFAGGYDIERGLPEGIANLFRGEDIEAVATSGKRVVRLGSLDRAIERIHSAGETAHSQYRRPRLRGA